MPLNLTTTIRNHMLAELKADAQRGAVTGSKRFTALGVEKWRGVLHDALANGTPESLIEALSAGGWFEEKEATHTPKGAPNIKNVSSDAAKMLGRGEFNRYYMRAVCLDAMASAHAEVEVYRAYDVAEPRGGPAEGSRFGAASLLDDLRRNVGKGTDSRLGAPNSGLSVRVVS